MKPTGGWSQLAFGRGQIQEAVSCLINENEKKGITVITGIDAAGTKSYHTVVGNGKAQR
jgi:hypothetical protein